MLTLFRSFFAPPRHLILPMAALWVGLSLSERRAGRHGVPKDALNNVVFYGLLAYIVGGRLFFVLTYLSAFVQNPLNTLSLSPDLFDSAGALISTILVGIVYGRRKQLPLWSTLDALTPLFATLAIGLSLAHLAAGTAFGSPTTVPWGMELWNATRHPTQIYDLTASLLIFALVWFRKSDSAPGSDFLNFTAWTAGARLFLEAFRGDSTLIFEGIRLAQVAAWVVLAAALVALEWVRSRERLQSP